MTPHQTPPQTPSSGVNPVPEGPVMNVLVVDDETPAVTQMQWLLGSEEQAGRVFTAANAAQAKHLLETEEIDVVLLDIHMPGQSGLELARELRRRADRTQVVFVTADAQPAVEAFELEACDYLLKPVRASRLSEALRRAKAASEPSEAPRSTADPGQKGTAQSGAGQKGTAQNGNPRVAVLHGDTTIMLRITDIRWVQAHGDYARLHTADSSYLLRIALGDLEEQWSGHGFVRIHRSHVVNLNYAEKVIHRQGRMSIFLDGAELSVSRRLMPHVRERLQAHRVQTGRLHAGRLPAVEGSRPGEQRSQL